MRILHLNRFQDPDTARAVKPQSPPNAIHSKRWPRRLTYLENCIVLASVDHNVLAHNETRKLAAKYGLSVADKPDSQDICFVPNGRYADVIEKLRPNAAEPGDIVHLDGRVLGQHKGVIHYTVGQRRGLGIGGGDPLYVVKLDADARHVIVGPKDALATRTVPINEINWLGDAPLTSETEWSVSVRVRSTRPPKEAILRPVSDTTAEVELLAPEEGVAPGQACVFYQTDATPVLGGGWITRA